jgi:hypothetical protein
MARKRHDYIPKDKYETEFWAIELLKVSKENVGSHGLTDEMVNTLEQFVNSYSNDLDIEKELIAQKQKQVQKTNDDRNNLVNHCRKIAQLVKNTPDYSETVGKEFNIIGAQRQIDVENSQPVLNPQKVPQGWQFSFGLNDYFNGVNIYRKLPDEDEFKYLATDTRSPFVDKQEMVNGTQYCAYFILGDTEVGQQSGIVTIGV